MRRPRSGCWHQVHRPRVRSSGTSLEAESHPRRSAAVNPARTPWCSPVRCSTTPRTVPGPGIPFGRSSWRGAGRTSPRRRTATCGLDMRPRPTSPLIGLDLGGHVANRTASATIRETRVVDGRTMRLIVPGLTPARRAISPRVSPPSSSKAEAVAPVGPTSGRPGQHRLGSASWPRGAWPARQPDGRRDSGMRATAGRSPCRGPSTPPRTPGHPRSALRGRLSGPRSSNPQEGVIEVDAVLHPHDPLVGRAEPERLVDVQGSHWPVGVDDAEVDCQGVTPLPNRFHRPPATSVAVL